jgi:hypothetical protein
MVAMALASTIIVRRYLAARIGTKVSSTAILLMRRRRRCQTRQPEGSDAMATLQGHIWGAS